MFGGSGSRMRRLGDDSDPMFESNTNKLTVYFQHKLATSAAGLKLSARFLFIKSHEKYVALNAKEIDIGRLL